MTVNNDPKRFIRHTSCEQCGSSYANALYADGSRFCFSCRTYTEPPKDKTQLEELLGDDTKILGSAPQIIPLGISKPITERKISQKTCEFFHCKTYELVVRLDDSGHNSSVQHDFQQYLRKILRVHGYTTTKTTPSRR